MGRKRNDEKIQVVNIRMVKEPSIYSESRISCPEDAVKAIAKDMATYGIIRVPYTCAETDKSAFAEVLKVKNVNYSGGIKVLKKSTV